MVDDCTVKECDKHWIQQEDKRQEEEEEEEEEEGRKNGW